MKTQMTGFSPGLWHEVPKNFQYLTSSQVMLMLSVWGHPLRTALDNMQGHCSVEPGLTEGTQAQKFLVMLESLVVTFSTS